MEELKKIPTYKNPLNQRIAFYYSFYRYLFLALFFAAIALPFFLASEYSTIAIIILCVALFFAVVAIINFISMIAKMIKYKMFAETQGKTSNHLTILSGPPGAGKTLLEVLMGYFMSVSSWLTLQFERWLLERRLKKEGEKALEDPDVKELVEAYDFYVTNDGIPCYGGNLPVYSYEYQRYCYKFGAEHLKQEERVPYRMVGLVDEMGTTCTLEMVKDRGSNYSGATDMADFFRLCRQHAECRMLGSEQSSGNIYKDARNVVAQIVKCQGVKKVHEPKLIRWLYNFLDNYFTKRMNSKQAERWGEFMYKLKSFLKYTGFLRVEYTLLLETFDDKGNLVKSEEKKGFGGRNFKIPFPAMLPIKYFSRFLRESYKALSKPIRMTVYKRLGLTREEAMGKLKAETLRLAKEQRDADKRKELQQTYEDRLRIKQEVYANGKNKKSNSASNK